MKFHLVMSLPAMTFGDVFDFGHSLVPELVLKLERVQFFYSPSPK